MRSENRIEGFLFETYLLLDMDTINPEKAFRKIETDDEITIETAYGDKIKREVTRTTQPSRDTLQEHVVVGRHEENRILMYSSSRDAILLKTVESDGSLSVPGKKITSFVNWSKEYSYDREYE